MAYFTEQALTPTECLTKIRSKYGSLAKVLVQRTVRKGGILGIGGHEEIEMTGTYGMGANLSFEEEKLKILANAGKNTVPKPSDLQVVLDEIHKFRDEVGEKLAAPATTAAETNPSIARLEEDLALNDFTPGYIKSIVERVRREFALEDLDDYELLQRTVAQWIGQSISIYREPSAENETAVKKRPRIIVLVGATGVGKTTTIAKLAYLYGEWEDGRWNKELRLVTLDNYRIGGKQQIEGYGQIMEIPVSSVESYDGLREVLALYRHDADFILVDTIGKSPRNFGELGDMKSILEACGSRAEIHLCLSSSTKASDITEALKQFEPFKYRSVIVTKLDETGKVGNVISALSGAGKPVSFITTGQTVPTDIERATVMRFLLNLENFSIDRDRLSKLFDNPREGAL